MKQSDVKSPADIFDKVGKGGIARMFVQGKENIPLSSLGELYATGSTLAEATAYTDSAMARASNLYAGKNVDAADLKKKLGASEEHPVHEVKWWNIGGTRVMYYYGLKTVRSSEHILNGGHHVQDTAVGVLLLDKYNINNRPGDPSNPLTFWPYSTFYGVPQGVDFGKCKNVGASGSNALEEHPLETTAICQALQSMAEVASRNGYKRLMIVGDCGYYALACSAYAKKLTCWGNRSWVPHPDGAFAGFCVPRFKVPSLDLDVVLPMGTTQLIASNDPSKNLITNTKGASVVYLTADTRGWYSGKASDTVNSFYEKFLKRPWNNKDWHFSLDGVSGELQMLDICLRVNDSLLESIDVAADEKYFISIAERMVEYSAGSTAYLVGLYLGHMAGKVDSEKEIDYNVWYGAESLLELVEPMAKAEDGTPLPKEVIVERCAPIFDYLEPLVKVLYGFVNENYGDDGSVGDEFLAYAALLGNPAKSGEDPPNNWEEMKLLIALRMQDTLLSLMAMGELSNEVKGLPVGDAFARTYAMYNAQLNEHALSKVERSHGIDGENLMLFDCRYVPGFGLAVNQGLTVWTAAKNYFWMGSCVRRFCQIMQEKYKKPLIVHLECTEIFSFAPFLQEMGVPVVDAINLITTSSRCTDAPMRFVQFTQTKDKNGDLTVPPTPSALVADLAGNFYYRDKTVLCRSPTKDADLYTTGLAGAKVPLEKQKEKWKNIAFAQPLHGDFKLKWGLKSNTECNPGDSLYAASCALDVDSYVNSSSEENKVEEGAFVQYKLKDEDEGWAYDKFFDGRIFHDGI